LPESRHRERLSKEPKTWKNQPITSKPYIH
jgi:hypothetical protein